MHRSTLTFRLLIALVLVASGVHSVPAQQPTSEQRNAIRSACRSDFIANCAGVEPGGKEAFECLLRSHDNLSASCKTAVDTVAAKLQAPAAPAAAPPPAGAPSPAAATAPAAAPSPAANSSQTAAPASATPPASTSEEELNAVRGACTLNDIAEHCSWIAPTSPEIVLCLRANVAGLSSACRAAVSGSGAPPNAAAEPSPAPAAPPTRQKSREASPSRAATTAAPGAASVGAPGKPTAAQASAIRSACRSDFMANCSGVQPGGPAALQCLQSNAAKLSQPCRTAVAAIGGGAASGAAPSPATAEAPAAAPLRPRGFIPLQNRLAVFRICRPDVVALCAGTPPGGGQIIDCLAANARSLSPDCYAAVARVSR